MSSLPQPDAPKARVRRWAIHEPWKPSSKKLLAYLEHRGLPIPRHRKTKQPTTGEDELERLLRQKAKGDPVLTLSLEDRRVQKGIGFLSDAYTGRDGRFHPEWTLAPKMGRLSSRAPNLTNQPQGRKGDIEAEVAETVRSTIIPSDGWLLWGMDWKAVQALLVGWFAEDPTYMRLARLGVYSHLVAHMPELGLAIPDLSLPDPELRKVLDAIKDAHELPYAMMKKTVLARGFGEGAFHISKDLGCSFTEAQRYITVYETAAPRIKAWQRATQMRAHKEGKLVNPFNYALEFWDVLGPPNEKGESTLGSEANEALAFLPQSTEGSMLKEAIILIDDLLREAEEECRLTLAVHDNLGGEVREDCVGKWLPQIKAIMEHEWPELGGLSVEVEPKVGRCWVECKPKIHQGEGCPFLHKLHVQTMNGL